MIYDTVYGSDGTSTAEIGNGMKDAVPVPILFLDSSGGLPVLPEILHYYRYTMIL